ncbi:hypothetical protein D1007_28065 [Hordeum vulgare]|nr:hypothetical protein D1007_28065 [Hordeum vulgare]
MTAPLVSFTLVGHRFGANVGWRGLEEEQYPIYRKANDGSRWHDAAEFWRRMRADGYVQDNGAVCHRGGVDGRPDKVNASVPVVEMDQ